MLIFFLNYTFSKIQLHTVSFLRDYFLTVSTVTPLIGSIKISALNSATCQQLNNYDKIKNVFF